MKNSILFCLLVLSVTQIYCQNTFVDSRDGHKYESFSFNEIEWMTSNLKYLSPDSYCEKIRPKDEICKEYNFYPKQDLSNVCPDGWRMPLSEDWDEYWAWYYKQRIKKHASIELDTLGTDNREIWLEDTTQTLNLFSDENPLQFYNSDWIQGRRRIDRGTMSMWISNGQDNFHTHMGPVSIVKHEHKHHIDDKKRKIRQFVVRCVRDKPE